MKPTFSLRFTALGVWITAMLLLATTSLVACNDDGNKVDDCTIDDSCDETQDPNTDTDTEGCENGQTVCDDLCVTTLTDPDHCGKCGNACADDELCVESRCTSKEQNETPTCDDPAQPDFCTTICVDLKTSPTNCGTCEHVCDEGDLCIDGSCITPAAEDCEDPTPDECDTGCTTFQTDNNNCGSCGNACSSGLFCLEGKCTIFWIPTICFEPTPTPCADGCTNLQSDKNNCGACGNTCESSQVCTDGECKRRTRPKICIDPLKPNSCDGTCTNFKTDNNNCGSCGNVCKRGYTCSDSKCTRGKL